MLRKMRTGNTGGDLENMRRGGGVKSEMATVLEWSKIISSFSS